MTMPTAGSACRSPPGRTSRIEAQIDRVGRDLARPPAPRARAGDERHGFGAEVRDAMDRRVDHLVEEGLARRQGQRVDLRARSAQHPAPARAGRSGRQGSRPRRGWLIDPSAEGEHVAGIYRQRVTLSSGRFAMIDDGLGFQLVPWRPALEQHLGRQVSGAMSPGGTVDWSFGPKRGLGV